MKKVNRSILHVNLLPIYKKREKIKFWIHLSPVHVLKFLFIVRLNVLIIKLLTKKKECSRSS